MVKLSWAENKLKNRCFCQKQNLVNKTAAMAKKNYLVSRAPKNMYLSRWIFVGYLPLITKYDLINKNYITDLEN